MINTSGRGKCKGNNTAATEMTIEVDIKLQNKMKWVPSTWAWEWDTQNFTLNDMMEMLKQCKLKGKKIILSKKGHEWQTIYEKNKFLQDSEKQIFSNADKLLPTQTWLHQVCGKCYTYIYLYLPQTAPMVVQWVRPGAKWYGTKLLVQDHIPTQCYVLTKLWALLHPLATLRGVGHAQWAPVLWKDIFKLEVSGIKQDLIPFWGQLVPSNFIVEGWIIDPYIHSLLYCTCDVVRLSTHNGKLSTLVWWPLVLA